MTRYTEIYHDLNLALVAAGIDKNHAIIRDIVKALGADQFTANPSAGNNGYILPYRSRDTKRAVACVYKNSCDSMTQEDATKVIRELSGKYPTLAPKHVNPDNSKSFGLSF